MCKSRGLDLASVRLVGAVGHKVHPKLSLRTQSLLSQHTRAHFEGNSSNGNTIMKFGKSLYSVEQPIENPRLYAKRNMC